VQGIVFLIFCTDFYKKFKMKKILFFCLMFIAFLTVTAQKPKPKAKTSIKKTSKAKTVKKQKVASAYDNLSGISIYTKDDNGQMYINDLNKGDKLVYEINANGQTYDFIVTPEYFSYDYGFEFNYEMTNSNKTSGRVMIAPKGRNEGTKYVNYFTGGELILTDASTVLLSYKNFMDMPDKKTQITLDDNAEETFYRAEKDEVDLEINFKGKKVKVDAFKINNAADQSGNKTMWIQNGSGCPLIVYMNLGWTVKLKEVR
jgi:hypothetical protein